MSFLGKLAEKGLSKADEALTKHGESWVSKAVDSGRGRVTELAEQNLGTEGAVLAGKGFDWIEANKARVAGLGHSGLTAVVGFVAAGDDKQAKLIYLAQEAGWGELDAAADGAAANVHDAVDAQASALGLAKDVARVLLPILMTLAPF
jgi:hypothetical protein